MTETIRIPLPQGEILAQLAEECVEQLNKYFRPNAQTVNIIKATKLKRWMDRLQEARDHEQMAAGV